MLFHIFSSQDERRKFGGSYFIEIQYCSLDPGTAMEQIVSVDAITHWKDDSLYIYGDDEEAFASQYGDVLTDGTYNNGQSGIIDTCGINYYAPHQIHVIVKRIEEMRPSSHQMLLAWLKKVREHNGFYVLGL
ncbi:MAG: hypothetical protein HFF08_10935 [Oscillospiraceae bacterium]|nr:hypothetical protein [Oscillospiraceae bacterium]